MNTSPQYAIIFVWLLCGIMFNTSFCSFNNRCSQQDMHALLNFKQGVRDPSGVLSSWSIELDCCEWKGVICNNITSRVTGITLPCSTTLQSYVDKEDKSHCLTGVSAVSYTHLEVYKRQLLNFKQGVSAVSYTHLEVYKRQLLNFKQGVSAVSYTHLEVYKRQLLNFKQGVSAVSYTHLEVYKRQLLNFKQGVSAVSYTHLEVYKRQLLNFKQGVSAVSYTHLEVYKRQLLNFKQGVSAVSYTHLEVYKRQLLNFKQGVSAVSYTHLEVYKRQLLNFKQGWLPYISSLEYLNLNGIDLSKETNWLQLVTMLPSLSFLNMHDCELKDLSLSLQYANFTKLEFLSLSRNEFNSELPKWLFNLSSDIYHLYLSSSSLKGHLPKTLLNLLELKDLGLYDNNFDGPIPDWLGEFDHLETLGLGDNMFSGSIPTNLGNLSSLINLDVSENPLTGVVSERNLAKLSKLKGLEIYSYSTLIFDFDPHWIPPFQLEELFLRFSNPNLPGWLYTQRSIRFLTIWDSSFEASNKFWNFISRISQVDLQGNLIDGNMSNVLLNSTIINLSWNGLKGCLPQLSPNVAFLSLSNNSLSGEMSPLLCGHNVSNGKNNLLFLDISLNNLSGGLTNCWKNWKSLVAIHLGSNNLSGKIPPSMGLLSNLTSLHLHENKLHGEIPLSLKNCHSLLVFNVRNNDLSGNIPDWISKGVMALQLRSNHFGGKIPPQICQMSSLLILDIAYNAIYDHIPSCLGNIKTLVFNNASLNKLRFYFPSFDGDRYLFNDDNLELVTKGQVLEYDKNLHFMTLIDMSSNNLSGAIPPQMFSLVGLSSLNLSNNKLVGKIPYEIGNMKNLESLDFSSNQLESEIPQSLSNLSFLGYLNLSFNNLTGKIPSGTQLQGFSVLSYIGNRDLCGSPLTKMCFQDDKHKDKELVDEDGNQSKFWAWFYIGLESGFVTGFLGVCCAIFLNRNMRHVCFKLICNLRDQLYVMVNVNMNPFH
ncbi:LRR receptor-like serine/threonine-protein kinase FLS2 [Vigna unguiculata]|uniref:LRR receptor-like serine/threonine-protein kinase FLS2 n=1 Tax=Vigna unguiculata TaxID=3917 RepID=A0A4D6MFK9_VIGUN|nr:LRR receptor-like serine/threonine-protein kinase FLS2 [Vigna unguiculata]